VCPGVWLRGCAPESVPLLIRCGGPLGEPCVQDPPLEEIPHVGRPDEWDKVQFVGRVPQ
jgi:hypothetical protein